MRMTVLASGSKGNSTVISSSRTRVLVDAGLSCRELLKRMAIAGEDPALRNSRIPRKMNKTISTTKISGTQSYPE